MKSGDSVHFSGSMKVTCTAYTAGYGGVGTRTATGTTVHVGTVAVDKKVIPLGTEMFIVGSSGPTPTATLWLRTSACAARRSTSI